MNEHKSSPWIIGYVITLHLAYGAALLFGEVPPETMPGDSIRKSIGIGWVSTDFLGGVVLLGVALLALYGLISQIKVLKIVCMLPQQFVLMLSFYHIVSLALGSSQGSLIIISLFGLTALWHTLAILDVFSVFRLPTWVTRFRRLSASDSTEV